MLPISIAESQWQTRIFDYLRLMLLAYQLFIYRSSRDCRSLVDTDNPLSTIDSTGALATNVSLEPHAHPTGNLSRL
jgi:hypothetical protein